MTILAVLINVGVGQKSRLSIVMPLQFQLASCFSVDRSFFADAGPASGGLLSFGKWMPGFKGISGVKPKLLA